MRALQIMACDGKPDSIAVANLPLPRPGNGEVLVKVFASPVNPSDLLFLQGLYRFKKPLPAILGFEGSGIVVEAGPGMLGRSLKGKRVACPSADEKIAGGMWAEYAVTSAKLCISLRKDVDLEQGAVMIINPLTAWAPMDEARRGRHKAVVRTASASALGRMIIRLGWRFSIPVINVLQRTEQVQLLRNIGGACA